MSRIVKDLFATLIISAGIFLFISPTMAQESDTIYLKDGSIIKGEIIETNYTADLRIENIKVRIAGGTVLAFTSDQILRLQKVKTNDVKSELSPTPTIQPNIAKQIAHYKSPGVACILSRILFPGIGQFYNEQPGKGAAFLVAGLVGAVMLVDGSKEITTYDYWEGYTTEPKDADKAALGAVIFLGSWIWSGIDAYSSAKSINESLALSVTPSRVSLCYRF